ncbi:hypothetical protein MSAN_01117500 [Mycena sanguinolenta]|uniref:Uncharacterized protein n=1 Tax=Mycena sanguinolenta TaxID=230812 RepID=A0A8H6YJB7_9AGAR|nr:hypothetical protein MSAN_01117500 [Mycena sanguinolenta]
MQLLRPLFGLAALQHSAHATQFSFSTPTVSTSSIQWTDLTAPPDANATSQLIFDAVNAVLQHWPHTRYRNGHTIIPGTVPVGTLLYHGRQDRELPRTPEWTSVDPEHSFPFAGDSTTDANTTAEGCWQHTLVTTRPLKVLYFDGSSAANIKEGGTLDMQDLLIWGKVDPARWVDERERLDDLCAWGNDFGLDGFVRMEMDFEIMLCDFSQGVELISTDYLAALWSRHITPPLQRHTALSLDTTSSADNLSGPNDRIVADILRFETIHAGSWHNQYPGDTRFKLDLTGLVSFYDTTLAPSLIPARRGKERWDHRPAGISATDLTAVKARVGEVLTRGPDSDGSGIDWQASFHVIVDRYADRLETLAYLLNTTTPDTVSERARLIQTQLRIMLTPYILYTARPTPGRSSTASDSDTWALPVWKGCATKHTAHIHASPTLQSRMTVSERLLLTALDKTNREICRVVVKMWAAGVHAGLDPFIPLESDDGHATTLALQDSLRVVHDWRADADRLMSWLDWAVWVKCRPACGVEEMCYLPTWPFFWHEGRKDERWERPQPRCIRRFEPYSQL